MIATADRYVARVVLAAIGVVLACFVTLTGLFAFMEELREEEAGYTALAAGLYVLLTLPRRIHELMPYVAFLGALIGLGVLAGNSEVTVLRAAGTSLQRVFGALAVAVLGCSAIAFALGELAAPRLDVAAEALRTRALQGTETIFIDGHWHREGRLFTHVEGFDVHGQLIGVTQFQLDDGARLRRVQRAQLAERDRAAGGWRLRDVAATALAEDAATVTRVAALPWASAADIGLLSARALVHPRRLSLADLAAQIRYMDGEGLDARRHRLAYWSKLLQPLATLGLALVAVWFVVGPLRERGMGARIAAGIVVGLAFKYLQDLLAPASLVFGIPAWLAVLLPIGLCWAVGAMLLSRAR